MIRVRPASARGRTTTSWLDSRHTFSFGDYRDPGHMGFRALRVINDDRVAPGGGFGTHPHRDMEIVSYVVEGAMEHKDSLGTGSVIRPGDVQRMSAGTGVQHSEWNQSKSEQVRFLQIWILPARQGLPPSYEQRRFPPEDLLNRLRLVASPDGRDGSVTVHQDVAIYAAQLRGAELVHEVPAGRHAWLQLVHGGIQTADVKLVEGDGASIDGPYRLSLVGDAEVLLFDLG